MFIQTWLSDGVGSNHVPCKNMVAGSRGPNPVLVGQPHGRGSHQSHYVMFMEVELGVGGTVRTALRSPMT